MPPRRQLRLPRPSLAQTCLLYDRKLRQQQGKQQSTIPAYRGCVTYVILACPMSTVSSYHAAAA